MGEKPSQSENQEAPATDLDVSYIWSLPSCWVTSTPYPPKLPIWLVERVEAARYSLHHHLRYDVKGGEAGVGKALLVLAHLDGFQPLIHRVKAGVVGDRAVQQWQVDAGGGAGDRDGQGTSAYSQMDRNVCGSYVGIPVCSHRCVCVGV